VSNARNLALQQSLMALATRSFAMGVVGDDPLTALDAKALQRLVGGLNRAKLLRHARVDLAPLLRDGPEHLDSATAAMMQAEVGKLIEVLEESPAPASEWARMREIFGDEMLSEFLGTSTASIRRYASGSRETAQPVAERLHWLAMVVSDLAGAYNAYGMRRWFERPRTQLDGRSPRQLLGKAWSVDDESAKRVRALAAALSGAQGLAV
jgi:hypothetical protein